MSTTTTSTFQLEGTTSAFPEQFEGASGHLRSRSTTPRVRRLRDENPTIRLSRNKPTYDTYPGSAAFER